jgi:hypothetical protein
MPKPNRDSTVEQFADGRGTCIAHSNGETLTDFDALALLIPVLLRSKEAAHALPVAREIAIAPAFLNALADHLAGTKRAWRDPCDASVQSLSNRLPKDFIRRRAFEKLVRDLIWEIEQPQAS